MSEMAIAAAALEHAVHLGEQLLFVFRPDQVEHAVGHNHVDGFIRDQRLLAAHLVVECFKLGQIGRRSPPDYSFR